MKLMKCACGYEKGTKTVFNINRLKFEIEYGDFDFIKMKSVESENGKFEYDTYACPKCGTVKIDV